MGQSSARAGARLAEQPQAQVLVQALPPQGQVLVPEPERALVPEQGLGPGPVLVLVLGPVLVPAPELQQVPGPVPQQPAMRKSQA